MSAPYCHTPAELPDLRLWLVDQWCPGRTFHDVAAPQLDTLGNGLGSAPAPGNYAKWEREALKSASLWWVGPDMVDLLLATAAGIPDDATFGEVMPPEKNGLIVFAKPWSGIDAARPGREVQVDAVLWGPSVILGNPCMSASTYRRISFDAGLDPEELSTAVGTGAMHHATLHQLANTPDPGVIDERGIAAGGAHLMGDDNEFRPRRTGEPAATTFRATGYSWMPLGRSDWKVVEPINAAPWPMSDAMLASFVEDRKVLAALWVLLTQPGIASQTEERPERQARRRSERAGIPAPLSRVRVVRLRELPADDHEPEHGEPGGRRSHDHRWLVRGFWRWQPVGVGRRERRLTFVSPHIRGPKDKPLHVPPKVNAWIR